MATPTASRLLRKQLLQQPQVLLTAHHYSGVDDPVAGRSDLGKEGPRHDGHAETDLSGRQTGRHRKAGSARVAGDVHVACRVHRERGDGGGEVCGVDHLVAVGCELGQEALSRSGLQRLPQREVGRGGGAGDVNVPRGIECQAGGNVVAFARESGEQDGLAVRVKFLDEDVVQPDGVYRGAAEVEGPAARHVCAAGDVRQDSGDVIVVGFADESGVLGGLDGGE